MNSHNKIRDRIKELRRVKASELVPNPHNWRLHPKAQADALRGLLAEIGFADALLARETPDGKLMLIDGHLRAEITPHMEVPVIVLDVNEKEADKILLTLDPLAGMAGKDDDKVRELLASVEFESKAVGELLERVAGQEGWQAVKPREVVQDEVPIDRAGELQKKWKTTKGQTWAAGEHRLLCGDCRALDKPSGVIDLLLTDPPYGIGIVHVDGASDGGSKPWGSGWGKVEPFKKNKIIAANRYHEIEGDDKPFDPAPLIGIADRTVLWGANYYADKLPSTSGWLCWDKREDITRAVIQQRSQWRCLLG